MRSSSAPLAATAPGRVRPAGLPARVRVHARYLAATLVTALCLLYLVVNTDIAALSSALRQTDVRWLMAALALSAATVVFKGVRWWALYPEQSRPNLGLAIVGVAAGQVANWAAPLRMGEVLRVALAASPDPVERARSVATSVGVLVIEKLLDSAFLVLTVAALVVLAGVPGWLSVATLVVSTVACTAGLAVALRVRRGAAIPWRNLRRWVPGRLAGLLDSASGVGDGLSAWLGIRIAVAVLGCSIAAWVLGAATNSAAFTSAGIEFREPLAPTLAVLAGLYGAAIVPALPGRLGVFQYVCVVVLTPFGVQFEPALVFSMILYVAVYAPPIVLGLASVLVFGRAPWRAVTARASQS